MGQGTSRKITIIVLVFLTIALGVLAVFVARKLQESQAPEETQASGFGPGATTDLFENVDSAFRAVSCDYLLSPIIVNEFEPTSPLKNVKVTTLVPETKIPKACLYVVDDSHYFWFYIHTYDIDSFIDDSQQALFVRINTAKITQAQEEGDYPPVSYFFGPSKQYTGLCHATLFHSQNDFEYAEVIYQGYTCDSPEMANVNRLVTKILADKMTSIMTGVTYKYKGVPIIEDITSASQTSSSSSSSTSSASQ